jgi:excisionase family DNA binding protein
MSATATKTANFVSVATAARTLGVSEATVRRRLDDGSLLGFRLGATRRVLRSQLDRLVAPERHA